MPAVHIVCCEKCDFSQGGLEFSLFAVLENGDEVLCPHPCESLIAETHTGKSFSELRKVGRLKLRRNLLCLECGEVGYYGIKPYADEVVLERDIVETEVAHYFAPANHIRHCSLEQCAACQAQALLPISGDIDGLGAVPIRQWLVAWQHIREMRARKRICPQCKQEALRWGINGIS